MKDKSTGCQPIAVVTPFLDKRHGTERCVVEQVERLARQYEVHVYSNRVEDIDLSHIVWHRVPALPGPHLPAYCWWVLANHLWRWWDARFRNLAPAVVYSPGINCFDADVISVHIVFAEFLCQTKHALQFRANPVKTWPRLMHRRIYYRLVIGLECLVYGRGRALLTPVAAKVARDLERYGRVARDLPVVLHGIDVHRFNAEARTQLHDSARRSLGMRDEEFCLLLVGNDWKKKGLDCLLEALGKLSNPSIRLLVVGMDIMEPYHAAIDRLHLNDRLMLLPPRPDVEFYYAAADLYVGPSLEDAFGLPPLEAMACGVPSIVSSQAGVSEVITHGVDGFILDDPRGSARLADLISLLHGDPALRQRIGERAAHTARQYAWDRNAEQLSELFKQVLARKQSADYAILRTGHARADN